MKNLKDILNEGLLDTPDRAIDEIEEEFNKIKEFVLDKKNDNVKDEKLFLKVLRSSFAMRRKKLLNNLEEYGKDKIKAILAELNIDENVRAEELDLEDFVRISNKLL